MWCTSYHMQKIHLVARIPLSVSISTYLHLIFVSLSLNLESVNSSRLAGQWIVGICLSLCPIHSSQQTHTLICNKCVLLCLEFTSVSEIQTYILLLSQQTLYSLNHPKLLFKNQSDIRTYTQSHMFLSLLDFTVLVALMHQIIIQKRLHPKQA